MEALARSLLSVTTCPRTPPRLECGQRACPPELILPASAAAPTGPICACMVGCGMVCLTCNSGMVCLTCNSACTLAMEGGVGMRTGLHSVCQGCAVSGIRGLRVTAQVLAGGN